MKKALAIVGMLAMAPSAWAQVTEPATPTSVEILVLPSTGDPVTVSPVATRQTAIAVSSPLCNLAASVTPVPNPLVNPTVAEFDDPFTTGRVCRVALPTGLPTGTGYRGVAVFVATCVDAGGVTSECRGPRSTVAVPPFNVAPVKVQPASPTNLVVRP